MIPKTMKAWILTEIEKLELQEVPVPVPADNQVLVKIDRACICNGSDPGIYHGHEAYQTPLVFGHEASGRIVKKGSAVTQFEIGDRVSWWFEAGAFAEYQTVTPENVAMVILPDEITEDQGPVMELVLAACRALMPFPATENRKKITICGLGPSGLVLIQYAKALGYEQVIGWDLYESRRELAKKLGADFVYDPREITEATAGQSCGIGEPAATASQACGTGEPAATASQSCGTGEPATTAGQSYNAADTARIIERTAAIPQSDIGVLMMGDDILPGEPTATAFMRTIRVGGEVVSYGHPEGGMRFSPYVFQSRDLKMWGPEQDMNEIRKHSTEIVEMSADGRIQIEPLITHRIDFEDFLPAFENLLAHPEEQIKVIMKWRDEQ